MNMEMVLFYNYLNFMEKNWIWHLFYAVSIRQKQTNYNVFLASVDKPTRQRAKNPAAGCLVFPDGPRALVS